MVHDDLFRSCLHTSWDRPEENLKSAPLPQRKAGGIGVREPGHVLLARFCVIRSARARRSRGAGAPDPGTAAVVLVVGGDVADRGVQASRCCSRCGPGELSIEGARVGESGEVGPVALQVAEEALDVRLVGGVPGRPWC